MAASLIPVDTNTQIPAGVVQNSSTFATNTSGVPFQVVNANISALNFQGSIDCYYILGADSDFCVDADTNTQTPAGVIQNGSTFATNTSGVPFAVVGANISASNFQGFVDCYYLLGEDSDFCVDADTNTQTPAGLMQNSSGYFPNGTGNFYTDGDSYANNMIASTVNTTDLNASGTMYWQLSCGDAACLYNKSFNGSCWIDQAPGGTRDEVCGS